VAGKWVARHYLGDEAYSIENIAVADDFSDADGVAILNYRQAQDMARVRMVRRAHNAAGKTGPLLVADAMDDYFAWLENEGRSEAAIADARHRDAAFIRPKLGDKEAEALTADDFRSWRDSLMKSAPRLRTKPGEKQKLPAACR
jgi:hypothetical protein